MYLVNRIYADRVGHQDAFFRDVLLDFVNHFTNKPDSTVVQLSNAGGKTTLLSMFYSCFEPNKNEWIQHRQTSNFKFRDYFTNELALIAIELVTESGLLVIGQYVQLRQDSDEHRCFFSFQPEGGLTFDNLPSLSRKTVRNYQDVQKWMHECSTKQPGNFFLTSNQSTWKEHLKAKGFDLWLIYKQMQFCHAEGGILSFSDFKNEEQFLAVFYAMVISPEQTQEIARTLSNAMRDHHELPRKKRQAQWVEKAYDWWQPLYQSARAYFELNDEHRRELTKSVSYDNGLVKVTDTLAEQSRELTNNQELLEKQKSSVESNKQRAEQIAEATKSAWLNARVAKHVSVEKHYSEQVALLIQNKQILEISIHYQEKNGAEANHKLANDWLAKLEQDNAPLLIAKNTAEAKLHIKFLHESNLAKEKMNKVQGHIETLKKSRSSEDNSLKTAQQEIAQTETELKRIFQDKLDLEESVEQYRLAGKVLSDESLEDAILRHESCLKDLEKKQIVQEGELANLRNEETQLKKLQKTIESLLSKLQRDKGEIEQWLSLYLQEQGQLCNRESLKALVHGEEIKLTAALLERGRRSLSNKRLSVIKLERTLDQLRSDIDRLEQHGSMLVDDNVQEALKFLIENGVAEGDIMAFPTYLMELYKEDEVKIKQIIESDPSRYLGIAIVNPNVVDKVENLAAHIDVLHRPVMASVYNTNLNFHDGIILPPADPACYSESLLAKNLVTFRNQYNETAEALGVVEGEFNALQSVVPQLEQFLRDYPTDVVEAKGEQLGKLQNNIEQEVGKLSDVEEKINLNTQAIIDKNNQLDLCRQNQQIQDSEVNVLKAFFEHKWKSVQCLILKEPELDGKLAQLKILAKEHSLKVDNLDTEIAQEQVVANKHYANTVQYGNRANEYLHHDISFDKTAETEFLALDTATLRKQYEKCCNTYMAQTQSEKAERARREVESSRKLLEEVQTAFYEAFTASKLDESFMPQISEQSARQKQEILSSLQVNQTELDDWKEKRNENNGQKKIVEREIQDFETYRKYPNANVLAPEIESKTDPVQLRIAYRNFENKAESYQRELDELEQQVKKLILELHDLASQLTILKLARSVLSKMIKEVPELANEVKTQAAIDIDTCEEQANHHLERCTELEKQKRQKYGFAEQALNNIRRRLDNPEARESISGVCVTFNQFELLYANRTMEHVDMQLKDQLNALKFQLAEDEAQFEQRLSHVVDHVDNALFRLNQAVNFSKIPSNHPLAGNKAVLKNRFKNDLADSERRTKVKLYVESLMKNEDDLNVLPASDTKSDLLTARLTMAVAKTNPVDIKEKDPFGLEFIKIGNTITYQPISESGGSGAQKLIQSMLLYLSLACMRQREKRKKGLYGGFLFLDNPFAQMNHAQMVSSGVMLAKSLGYQLGFFTGHRDANAFESFTKIISMCNTRKFDQANGRYLVEVEDDHATDPALKSLQSTIIPTALDVNEALESEVDNVH
mgnify:FL=1